MIGFTELALKPVSKFLYNNPQRGVKNAILLADHLNGNFIVIDFPLELPISLADLNTKLINVSTHIKGEMPDGMKMTFPEAEALMKRNHEEVQEAEEAKKEEAKEEEIKYHPSGRRLPN